MMMRLCTGIITVVMAASACLTAPIDAAPTAFQQVALTGNAAPGAGGAEYIFFGSPAINAAGDVAFAARLRTGDTGPTVTFDNDEAIFGRTAGAGSPLGIVAREDDAAPGAGGAEYSDFFSPALNAAGDVAFFARLQTGDTGPAVTGDNREAVFGPTAGAGSSLGLLAREDDLAPGAGGAEYDNFGSPTLNAAGDVAFSAALRTGNTRPTVTLDNREVVFGPTPGSPGTLGILAREDDAAPGAGGAEYDAFASSPALNAAGDVAFSSFLRTGNTGPTVTFNNSSAVFGPTAGAGAPLGLLARADDSAPGVGGAEYSSFGSPALNVAGDVAFEAFLRTGDTGPAVTGDNDSALFGPIAGAGSPLGIVAREDDPAPGAGGAEYSFFSDPALNAAGDMAFEAFLRTGDTGPEVDDTNDGALFAFVDGKLKLLLREGDPFTVFPDAGPPEVRTISDIHFDRRNGLSDTRGLAIALDFSDGTQGIFTTTIIPEPTSLALLATAAPLLLGRRRGRR